MTEKDAEHWFDFDDFLSQSKLVSKMGSLAGVAKMLPGMGNALDTSRIKEVEARIRTSEAMIQSMTKKERADPDLLIKDKTCSISSVAELPREPVSDSKRGTICG
jgi:signal recognition particle subunit SRP54